jgi:hypothetical protein
VNPRARRFAGESVADHGEQRGTGHARPRHREAEPDEHEGPGGRPPVEAVADRRQTDEEQEGPATAEAIADPAARVLIETVEEVLTRPEEADRRDRRAESVEILRREALPEVLAQRQEKRRQRHGDDVGLEASGGGALTFRGAEADLILHVPLDTIMKLLFQSLP